MKKHKILQLITTVEPGGAQEHVYQLASRLNGSQYEIIVAAGPKEVKNSLDKRLNEINIEFLPIPHLKREINVVYDLKAILTVVKILKKYNISLIHCHSSKAGVIGRIAGKIAGVPCVFTAHGFVFTDFTMHPLKREIYIVIEKLMGKISDYIITVSHFDKNIAIKRKIINANKLISIPNGVNMVAIKKAKYKNKRKKTVIGTITRLVKEKALDKLIFATKLLIEKGHEVNLFIAGEGPLKNELIDLSIQLGIQEDVFFFGFINDVSTFLDSIDIFVMSSIKEGMPFALLEAMAAQKEIVCTAVGGINELLTDNCGILVEPNNIEALALGIEKLIENQELGKIMARNAQMKILKNYNIDFNINKVREIYNALLS